MQHISKDLYRIFQGKERIISYPFVLVVLFSLSASPAYAGVHSPFPHIQVSQSPQPKGENAQKFSCGEGIPDAVVDLVTGTIYEDGDESHSTVDREKQKNYRKDTEQLYAFENQISLMANAYIQKKAEGNGKQASHIASCVQNWLYRWAKRDALLGDVNPSGELVRKWSLAALSSSYAEVMKDSNLRDDKKTEIKTWLHRVAERVMADFTRNAKNPSRNNNHLYWAAWAVGVTSYVTQDDYMLNWAMNKARIGVDQIQEDGSLPLEMARGQRALLYHIFAATPLVMLAELGRQNGVDLYGYNNEALHHLVTLSTRGLHNEHYFEEKTNKTQDVRSIYTSNGLAWLAPYNRRFSNKSVEELLQKYNGALNNRRIGGDMRIVYQLDGN